MPPKQQPAAPAPEVADAPEVLEYTVCEPIHHDGDVYQPGDAIHLAPKAAAPLLASGAISGGLDEAQAAAQAAAQATATEGDA